MIFLFPRWDMLVPCKVRLSFPWTKRRYHVRAALTRLAQSNGTAALSSLDNLYVTSGWISKFFLNDKSLYTEAQQLLYVAAKKPFRKETKQIPNRWYWWKKILHQLRLVVYPISFRFLHISGGAGFLPSTVPAIVWVFEFYTCLFFLEDTRGQKTASQVSIFRCVGVSNSKREVPWETGL